MSALTESPAWRALAAHRDQMTSVHVRDLFAADTKRFDTFSLQVEDILVDYSKNRVTSETMSLLFALARQMDWFRGLRAAVALCAPLLLGDLVGISSLGWAALGGFEAILADTGGPYRSRMASLATKSWK